MNDERLIGRRVKLVYTPYTNGDIGAGDYGTVVYSHSCSDPWAIPVKWDNGVYEPLVIGEDAFRIFTDVNREEVRSTDGRKVAEVIHTF